MPSGSEIPSSLAADDRVIHALFAAEIADVAIFGIDADTHVDRSFVAELLPFGAQINHAPLHGDGHAHAREGVLVVGSPTNMSMASPMYLSMVAPYSRAISDILVR